jgi:gamma-glutamyltranspeptidase/glutathione hydrolase
MEEEEPRLGTVVCPQPLAAAAGGRILESGGDAVDAAIAVAFAQGVVDPMMCGLGGTGRMLVYRASSQTVEHIAAGSRAGSRARPDTFRYKASVGTPETPYVVEGHENLVGYKATTIPGLVRGLWDAHTRYGRLPWSDLLQPAIELASSGFEVYPYLYRSWDPSRKEIACVPPLAKLSYTDECARIYLHDGKVYAVGEVLKQEDYAATLRRIAAGGADVFYRGDIGRAIADDFERHGGLFTREDLENYKSVVEPATFGTYRGYTIATDGVPGGGPVLIEALNILENLDLPSLGWQSPRYLDVLARVFLSIYADELRYLVDPRFEPDSTNKFLSKERAAELARAVARGERAQMPEVVAPYSGTTNVSVLDSWGNAVSLMHSNGNSSGVVTPGLGFLYNNHMDNFDPRPDHPNHIQPGKMPLYGSSPTMIFHDGTLWLISGSLSVFRVTAEVQSLVSIVDFGKDVQSAVEQPRIHADYDPETMWVEAQVPPETVSELRKLGWRVDVKTMTAPLCMIEVNAKKGPRAIIDHRGGGGHWPVGSSTSR